MKTKHIYYIAALAMLTACTNNEEFETITSNGMQKVTFAAPFVGKNLTRASGDISTDGANGTSALASFKIKVWGQEVNKPDDNTELTAITGKPSTNQNETPFNGGYDISHSESGWAADKEFYYPRDKYTFRFAAFAPADAINTSGEGTDPNGVVLNMTDNSLTFSGSGANAYGITNIPLVQEISNTNDSKAGWDLLVSNRVLSKPSTDGVTNRADINFTFQHILSKLSFYVYATESTGKKFYVKSIKAYLPKDNWTGSYKQNDQTAKPTAESKTDVENNSTSWSSTYHDTWAWEKKSSTTADFANIENIVTPTEFETHIVNAAKDNATTPNSYKEYDVFTASDQTKGTEVVLQSFQGTLGQGQTDNITCKSYFLAPTPAAEGDVKNYNFYVKIEYTVVETTDGNTTTNNYTGYLDLAKSDFKRFRQGWHHKVYIGLAHKTIRFISASVDEWDGEHNEDMTVSREVDGWTAEQN